MSDAVNKPAHYNQGSIECIDAMKIVLTQEEFRGYLKGNVFKYLWREKDKNGIEDLRKAKWYLDRLVGSFNASEREQLATGEVTGEGTVEVKPPDGWRWLEVGEVFRKGDTTNTIEPIPEHWVGTQCVVKHVALRRNKFEVGEKVIECVNNRIGVVQCEIGGGKYVAEYEIEMLDTKRAKYFFPHHLAPYIEDAT